MMPESSLRAHPDREQRTELLRRLRDARGSDCLIAYVTSTRPNLSAVMSLDTVRHLVAHVPPQRVVELDLFLHSDGGEPTVPWRLMTYLREYAERVNVLVPHRAFSAGTLTALGADKIVMHPLAMLGPIDPTVPDPFGPRDEETGYRPGVSVEDVSAYTELVREDLGLREPAQALEAFKLLAGQVHPLTLGRVKRGTQQAVLLGKKLLELRNDKLSGEQIESIVEHLTRKLYYHGHPINRREAEEIGLDVEWPPAAVETAMWDLYLAYEQDMNMDQFYDPIAEALRAGAVIPVQAASTSAGVAVDPIRRVVIESESQADVFTLDLEITLARAPDGSVAANVVTTGGGWTIE
jgi:hypothetical protein